MIRALALATVLAVTGTATTAMAAEGDWPCAQRRVPSLTPGLIWAGPPITDTVKALESDPALSELAARLALRRVEIADAEKMIATYASGLSEGRDEKLTALFARTFDLVNQERSAIMSGIIRYAHKQEGLSAAIEKTRDDIRALNAAEKPDIDRVEELQDKADWDARIFKERSQSLTYVCETPVILEQRLFAIARAIQGQMTSQ